jgi:PAS domain S-box-containing protein
MKAVHKTTEKVKRGKSNTKKAQPTDKPALKKLPGKTSHSSQPQTDSALHDPEKRFYEMLENIQLVAVVHDLAGQITFCNAFLLKITGYTRDEVLGKNWFAQFTPQVRAPDKDKYLQELSRGRIEVYDETSIRTKNDAEHLIRFSNTILRDAQGEIIGMTRLGEDVTEHRQVEGSLRESEQLFSKIFTDSPVAISIVSLPGGKNVEVNDAWCALTGFSREEAIGRDTGELKIFDSQERDRLIKEFSMQGYSKLVESAITTKSGEKKNVLVNSDLITTIENQFVIASVIDITERKLAEQVVRESETLFSKIFQSSPIGINIFRVSDNHSLHVNDAFLRIIGYSREEVEGHSAAELNLFADPDVRNIWMKILREGGEIYNQDALIRTKSGEIRTVMASMTVAEINGEPTVLVIATDITERNQIEERLHQSQELFSNAFHVSPAGIIITRIADGKIIDANEAFLDMFEFSRAEAVGHTSIELNMLSPEERSRLIQQQLESGGLHNFELLAHSKSGRIVNLLFSSKPMEINGETCHITTLIDISERKQAEKKLELQNQRLQVLREIDTAILSADSAESIVGAALSHIRKLIDCQRANLTLIDWETYESVIFNVSTDNETAIPKGRRFPLAQYEDIIQVLSQNKILLMNDLRALLDPRPAVQSLIKDGLQSLCSLPLFSHGKLIGMFSIYSDIPGFFNEDKTALGREVANQVAIAITQNSLLEETRLSRDRLADLSRKLVETREKEARAIGRELHDQIGQMLTALKLTMELAPQLPPELAAKKMTQSGELVNDLLSRVSNLSLELRPPMLDDLGLIPALTWHVNRFQGQTGIELEFKHSGVEGLRFSNEIETTAYRAVQEALTNVARHAETASARLEVRARDGILTLEIEDNGKGFDPQAEMAKHRSSGLRGIRERVSLVGGTFQIESQPGMGTKKIIRLPIPKEIS